MLAVKEIAAILYDEDFWEEQRQAMVAAATSVARNLVIEGVQHAASAGVVVDFNQAHREAIDVTKKWADTWWQQLNATTREGLRSAMLAWESQGLGKRGLPDLIHAIEPLFDKKRAQRIAVTEATRMFAEGNKIAAAQDPAIGGLQWQTAEDERVCPICGPRDHQIYPLGEVPDCPAHVNCRCALMPASWHYISNNPSNWHGGPLPKQPQAVGTVEEEEIEWVPPEPPFKLTDLKAQPTSLEGAHAKTIYKDAQGNSWLFKPDETSGIAELAGYRVAHYLGFDAPETYMVEIGGKRGSIQRMFTDIEAPVRTGSLGSLSEAQIKQVQNHQVVDWLISQHDTNDGAMLISRSGNVYAVDKGQAFKFFGKDKLDYNYQPNPNTIVYNELFKGYVNGAKYKLEMSAIEDTLARVNAMDDKLLLSLVKPYAEYAVKQGWMLNVGTFNELVLERKWQIKPVFEQLYSKAQLEREAWERANAPAPAPAATGIPEGAYTRIDDAFAQRVRNYGSGGQSIMVGGPQVEGGNFLAYELQNVSNEKRTLLLEGKIRPAAEKKLLSMFNITGKVATTKKAAFVDPYFNDFLTAIKHLNVHLGPGGDMTLNPGKANAIIGLAASIKTLSPDSLIKAHYEEIIGKLTGGYTSSVISVTAWRDVEQLLKVNATAYLGIKYEAFVPPPEPAAKKPRKKKANADDKLEAKTIKPYIIDRTMDQGVLKTTGAKTTIQGETAYAIDLGDGMTAVYVQQGDKNPYSKMGRLTIYRDNYQGTAAEIQDTIAQLNRVGLEPRLANKKDLELIYLNKVAHAAGLDDMYTPEATKYQAEVLQKVTPEMSVEDQIALHRGYWTQKLGVKRLEDLPGYDPAPHFDNGWTRATGTTSGSTGWAWWKRFDITEQDLEREMPGYSLTHSLSSGDTRRFLEKVLQGNGWLSCTEERQRAGVFQGEGMSPLQDQNTGGASYAFTRISNRMSGAHLYFDKDLLLRTDNVSYSGDNYGKVTQDNLRNRQIGIDGWKLCSGHGSNETIIKNGINLWDHLVKVSARSATEAVEIRSLLRQYGVNEIGGRSLEQVVVHG